MLTKTNLNQILLSNGLVRAAATCSKYKYKKIENRKEILISFHNNKCRKCGYNKNMSALDFHHLEPNQKQFNISFAIRYFTDKQFEEILIPEIKNHCILLCANCHRELHHQRKQLIKKRSRERLKKIKHHNLLIH